MTQSDAHALDNLREGYQGDAFSSQATCPLCGQGAIFAGRARNIHPEHAVEFSLRRCKNCRHMWIDPLPTQPLLDYLYRQASNSVIGVGWESTKRHLLTLPEQRILAAEKTSIPGRYFELGVGKGLLFERFRSLGWVCLGVEPGDWGAGIPGVVRSLSDVPEGAADVIVAVDVLEHVSDPIGMLKALRSLAGPSTRLYAAFPNHQSFRFLIQKEKWRMVRPLGHVHYFSKRSAVAMFREAGFSVQSARANDLWERGLVRQPKSLIFGAVQALGLGDQWLIVGEPQI
jgi:Methyltransferase domain